MTPAQPVALITGAARGIGRATAEAFSDAGYRVVLSDIHDEEGEQIAATLSEKGPIAIYVRADVANPDEVQALLQRVEQEFGRLDAACNNAGIEGEQAPTHQSSLENFDRIMAVNVRGLYTCLQAEIPLMLKTGGAIVNMSSVAGLVGFPGLPAYCASKGAVNQLTKAAALEYAEQGIRVNAVCPGAIKTEMIDRITGTNPETVRQFEALHPMNRMGTAREIAEAVVWLCDPKAGFVTGQTLAVDGGLVAR